MKKIDIYTDGGCRGNGKENNVGGYGIVLIYKNTKKEIKQGFTNTTNNIMELMAIVEGLKLLKEPCEVNLYSDSAYAVNAINNNWLSSWKKNNWKTAGKTPVKNRELWEELDVLLDIHTVHFIKVKGHSTNELNNRCDELANIAMDEIEKKL
jgi:ribonuclease HI